MLSVGLSTLLQTAYAICAGVINNTQAVQGVKVVAKQPWLSDVQG